MKLLRLRTVSLSLCMPLLLAGAAGCKDDPPPPPIKDQAAPATSMAATSHAELRRSAQLTRGSMPRLSPETMKLFRAETCYFGTWGLRYARAAYLDSLSGAEPSKAKLPQFGEYPQTAPQGRKGAGKGPGKPAAKKADGEKRRREPITHLPFMRHVRSCGVLKTLTMPKADGLDPLVKDYEKYIQRVNQVLVEAHRYYGRGRHERDELKRGKKYHGDLVELFPKLEEQQDALAKALETFRKAHSEPKEQLDERGTMGRGLLAQARAFTLLAMAKEVDAEAFGGALEELQKAADELVAKSADHKGSPYAKVMPPKMTHFLEMANAAKAAVTAEKLPVREASLLALAYTELFAPVRR
jgi:hypothetical protein